MEEWLPTRFSTDCLSDFWRDEAMHITVSTSGPYCELFCDCETKSNRFMLFQKTAVKLSFPSMLFFQGIIDSPVSITLAQNLSLEICMKLVNYKKFRISESVLLYYIICI